MEKINKYNYESFFMDFLDGNLAASQKEDLMSFLRMNPDLENELKEMENFRLEGEQIVFQPKQSLKKHLTLPEGEDYTVFDELCIAQLEGDLSPDKLKAFNKSLELFPHRIKTFELYQKTFLKPDRKIKYPDKSSLKRGKVIQIYRKTVYSFVGLAASALLLVGLFFSLPTEQNIPYISELSGEYKITDKKEVIKKELFVDTCKSSEIIKHTKNSQIDYKEFYPKQNIQINTPDQVAKQAIIKSEAPEPMTPKYGIEIPGKPLYANILEIQDSRADFPTVESQFKNFDKINRIWAQSVENVVQSNLANRDFSLWEIAELSFDGISKLTGKKLFLERHYDGQGSLQKLALHTESFKISTDFKK